MHRLGCHGRQQTDEWLDSLDGRLAPGRVPFCEDGLHHATTITKRIQVANSMKSRVLEAWDLSDD